MRRGFGQGANFNPNDPTYVMQSQASGQSSENSVLTPDLESFLFGNVNPSGASSFSANLQAPLVAGTTEPAWFVFALLGVAGAILFLGKKK